MNDDEKRYRNKDSFQKAALFWIKLANHSLFELNRQLLALAAIFLPITASLIFAPIKLGTPIKVFLIVIWLFLLISIIAGLIQNYVDVIYFLYLSRDSSKREIIWSDGNKSLPQTEKETDKLGAVKQEGSHWPIIIQSASFLFALILIITLGCILLFR